MHDIQSVVIKKRGEGRERGSIIYLLPTYLPPSLYYIALCDIKHRNIKLPAYLPTYLPTRTAYPLVMYIFTTYVSVFMCLVVWSQYNCPGQPTCLGAQKYTLTRSASVVLFARKRSNTHNMEPT
ncbi:hypothetical protein F4775DRAFT_457317 [Biscogniauxia sp. FL1348]|nr:hypothetical protein F4775DRAFT_457317 [Biscogniauxia sp. FL1348]